MNLLMSSTQKIVTAKSDGIPVGILIGVAATLAADVVARVSGFGWRRWKRPRILASLTTREAPEPHGFALSIQNIGRGEVARGVLVRFELPVALRAVVRDCVQTGLAEHEGEPWAIYQPSPRFHASLLPKLPYRLAEVDVPRDSAATAWKVRVQAFMENGPSGRWAELVYQPELGAPENGPAASS